MIIPARNPSPPLTSTHKSHKLQHAPASGTLALQKSPYEISGASISHRHPQATIQNCKTIAPQLQAELQTSEVVIFLISCVFRRRSVEGTCVFALLFKLVFAKVFVTLLTSL